MNPDDQRLAWQLRRDGMSWESIARELDCYPAVAEAAAQNYETRTDTAAAACQYALFD